MLRERSEDCALLRLIRPGLQAGRLETDGHGVPPATGAPQGGSIAPVLANGALHEALDVGCDPAVQAHGRGEARLYR
jgi:hypothetical protein